MLKVLRNELESRRLVQPFAVFFFKNPNHVGLLKTHPKTYCAALHDRASLVSDKLTGKKKTVTINTSQLFSVEALNTTAMIVDQSTIGKPKIYIEHESYYHHTVLEESSVYSNTLFKADPRFHDTYRLSESEYKVLVTKDWNNESPYHIATAFISLGVYSDLHLKITMDEEQFSGLVTAFVDKCFLFTDDQLIDCLVSIQIWPMSNHVKAGNFLKIWKVLDNVCHERHLEWTIDKLLYMMDLWYKSKLLKLSYFVYKGLNKISRKCSDLTRAQMVQTMFYMSCMRKLHSAISMREYEYYFQKHVTHLKIEEFGIFALAFFKTQTTILNEKLLLYTMQRVAQEIDTVNDITLTAIVKAIRFSYKPTLAFTANDLVSKLTEQRMDSLRVLTCIHIGHIITKVQFFNETTITKVAERFCSDPTDARLKDMERLALLLSMFNYIPATTPNILDLLVEQLELPNHVKMGENHPLTLVSIVYFLTMLQKYPEKIIQKILSEEFLKKSFQNKHMVPVQALQIDYNRVLEGPSGSEHLLTPEVREYISRKHSMFHPEIKRGKLNNFDELLLTVIEHTKQVLGGDEYCMVAHTLPHFPRLDILYRLDQEGRPVAIPEELRKRPSYEDVLRPEGEGWRCVVIGSRNMYMHNVPKLAGETVVKLRQLKLLGYTPVVIPGLYWMSEKDKLSFLKLKYFSTPS